VPRSSVAAADEVIEHHAARSKDLKREASNGRSENYDSSLISSSSASPIGRSGKPKQASMMKATPGKKLEQDSPKQIAILLRKFGVDAGHLVEFLNSVYIRSLEKGYKPRQIVSQVLEIQKLEKKFGKSYEELKSDFLNLSQQLTTSRGEIKKLESEILDAKKRKDELLKQHEVLERDLASYTEAREKLSQLGIEMRNLSSIEKFLISVKKERFNPQQVVKKLNEIADLESRSTKLREETSKAQSELDKLVSEIEARRKEFEAETNEHSEKIEQLERKYSALMKGITAYSELKELGVSAKKMLAWHNLITRANLDFATIESELMKVGNLESIAEQKEKDISNLQAKEDALKQSIVKLSEEEQAVKASIERIKSEALERIGEASSVISQTITELGEKAKIDLTQIASQNEKAFSDTLKISEEQIKKSTEEVKQNLSSALSELSSLVINFSNELKQTLDQVEPRMKTVSQAFQAGEMIGKYKAILPLLELVENGKGKETEALIAMWNVSSRFNMWLSEHYSGRRKTEISESLEKLLAAVNEEIQNASSNVS
jgi:myosin heavy subunit